MWHIDQRTELTASPLVSSQRPNTELAAASTEQRELRVVVIPAWTKMTIRIGYTLKARLLSERQRREVNK